MGNKYNDSEINVFDLMVSIVQKWRIMLVMAFLFAIVMGGYSYFTGVQALDDETVVLTDEQKEFVENAAKEIEKKQETLDSQREYNDKSLYQQLNPIAIKTVTLNYYIDNNFSLQFPDLEKTNNIIPLVQAYCAEIYNIDMYKIMSTEIDKTTAPEYFAEVVYVDTNYQESGSFFVKIFGRDEDCLNKMTQILKKTIESKTQEISKIYGDHTITLAEETYMTIKSSEVHDVQQANISRVLDLSESIETIKTSLTADELVYLNDYISNEQDVAEDAVPPKAAVSLKSIIFGAFSGILVTLVFAVATYILNKKLHYLKEFEDKYNVKYLGKLKISQEDVKTQLDRYLSSIRNFGEDEICLDESIDIICANIKVLMKNKGIKTFCIISDPLSEDEEKTIDMIRERFSSETDIKVLKHVLINSECIRDLSLFDGVVFVKKLQESTFDDMKEELRLCETCNVNVIGSITVY